jgi:hypothetical protein
MTALGTGLALPGLLPTWERSLIVSEPPDARPGSWIGGPSAVSVDGITYLAYRLRRPVTEGRGYANVVARGSDPVTFEPVAEVTKEAFDSASLERPALVVTPQGRWRLYVSVATAGSKHWRVDLLEAATPEGLAVATPRTVLPGDAGVGVKDPVVLWHNGFWHLWVTCHPLDVLGEEDRMSTGYAVSDDGVAWSPLTTVLGPRAGQWDSRGARLTSVLLRDGHALATYDGRASAEENWEERTGTAVAQVRPDGTIGAFTATDGLPAGSPAGGHGLRYVTTVPAGTGTRLYYEATRPDGAHHLRTELLEA